MSVSAILSATSRLVAFMLRDDASSTAEGVTGEVKDLIVAGTGKDTRVLATGVIGDKDAGKLAADFDRRFSQR